MVESNTEFIYRHIYIGCTYRPPTLEHTLVLPLYYAIWQLAVHRYNLSASCISCSVSLSPVIWGLLSLCPDILMHAQIWKCKYLDSKEQGSSK